MCVRVCMCVCLHVCMRGACVCVCVTPLILLQVFVCGPYPHWIFLSGRGGLYVHPMNIDGPVTTFAPFHNINCPHGFLYFNSEVHVHMYMYMYIF